MYNSLKMQTAKKYLTETEAYVSEEERLKVVWELLVYAHMMYKKVYVFKNFDSFSRSFSNIGTNNPPEEYWEGMHREKLIDHVKICIAFENFNKAMLLKNGFMVHLISFKKNRTMAAMQRNEPVPINEFLKSNQFIQDNPFTDWYLEGLQGFKTIPFSLTLSDNYLTSSKLDKDFVHYLKKINEKRNRLHYYKNYSGAVNFTQLLSSIKFAMEYGTSRIEEEIDSLKDRSL